MSTVTFAIEESKFDDDSKFIRIRKGSRFVCLNDKSLRKLWEKKEDIEHAMLTEKPLDTITFTHNLSPVLTLEVCGFKGSNYLSFKKNGTYLNLGYDDWEHFTANYKNTILRSRKRASSPSTSPTTQSKKLKKSTFTVNPIDLARFTMLILIRKAVKSITQSSCEGCIENYPSQNDHKCLNEADYVHELYFDEAYNHAERKYLYLLSKVIEKAGLEETHLLQPEDLQYQTIRSSFLDEIPSEIELLVEDCINATGIRI